MKNSVISICSQSHSDVWRLTSKLLPENVQAETYTVYVPESEIEHFKKITDPRIKVMPQEPLGVHFDRELLLAVQNADNERRYGWYLQQFYKIQAIQQATTDLVTIWDADCVPVAPIEVENQNHQVVYVNSSREFHLPYFENIERLLGLKRIQESSFVIPGFPMKNQWVSEFIAFVEKKHNLSWHKAIIKVTDFSLQSGFSETETLGTWVANQYPNEWIYRPGTWERYGQSRFGYARSMNVKRVLNLGRIFNLEIITFENWDIRGIRRIMRNLKRLLLQKKL